VRSAIQNWQLSTKNLEPFLEPFLDLDADLFFPGTHLSIKVEQGD